MTPDDETRDEEAPEDGAETPGDDQAGEHETPPPATYAGRKRAEQGGDEPEEPGEPDPAEEPEPADEPEDIRAGFTEEFDEIERSLDEELAGLGEPSEADQPETDPADPGSEAEESDGGDADP